MTSGAIQKGVPTKVFLLLVVLVSWPATPKSASLTSPISLSRTLAAFMSRWSFFSVCKYSSPFKTSLNKADIEESCDVYQTIKPQNDWYRSLVKTTSLHQVQRGAATQILHDDPELGPLQVGTEVLGHVGRVALAEHHDLLLDVFDLILGLFQINNFDSNNLNWTFSSILPIKSDYFIFKPVEFCYRSPWRPRRKILSQFFPVLWRLPQDPLSK